MKAILILLAAMLAMATAVPAISYVSAPIVRSYAVASPVVYARPAIYKYGGYGGYYGGIGRIGGYGLGGYGLGGYSSYGYGAPLLAKRSYATYAPGYYGGYGYGGYGLGSYGGYGGYGGKYYY